MQHSLFSEEMFSRVMRIGDSRRFRIDLIQNRDAIVASASVSACNGNTLFTTHQLSEIKGRPCISLNDYEPHLVLRTISRHLLHKFKIKLPSRDAIVLSTIKALSDSTPIYLIRKDIKSFYESIPIAPLRAALTHNHSVSTAAKKYIEHYFHTFCSAAPAGIPRGLVLSAVLAEISMQEYDSKIKRLEGVYRYFRYSDDILVFSFLPPHQILAEMKASLPQGMQFNLGKSEVVSVDRTAPPYSIKTLNYLGYQFSLIDQCGKDKPRSISVSISPKKISKLKTRIILSLKKFGRDRNFYLLLERLSFLSGNYRVQRRGLSAIKASSHVKSGIFFSYRLCGNYKNFGFSSHECDELKRLDGFYHSLLKNNANEFAASLGRLTAAQRERLGRISFSQGFKKKMFFRIDPDRIPEVKAAWNNA